MSSSPPGEGNAPKDEKEKKTLKQVLSRVKTVLKRGEGSARRLSTTLSPKNKESTSAKTEEPKASNNPTDKPAPKNNYENLKGVTKLAKSQLFEERAKKLGERYGIDLKPSEWYQAGSPDDTVLRIDKPIRMRVRRNCHKCNATFLSAKECPNCQHARCTKCTRYPPKRTEAEIIASRERRAAIIKANKENAPIIPDYSYGIKERKIVLTRPSKTGGQDLVHKKPRQRVRRTCHQCSTLFISGNKKCEKCAHVRCTDCPRDPPKKEKYPFGYPGDEFGPSAVPHFECKSCKTIFPTGSLNGTACAKCGQPKTDASPRVLPRKVEPEPDPQIVKQLQARLANLKVT